MASFCGSCGKTIEGGSKFCPSCGAPAAATPPPPQQQWAPPAASSQPVATVPKSSGALKIILMALGVIVVLIVVFVVGVGLFFKKTVFDNVSVKNGPGGKAEISINTPGGQVKLNAHGNITEEKLGVPIYPGAKAEEGAGTVSFTGNDEKGGLFGGASFTTNDSAQKVVDFYKSKLGNKVTVLETTSEGKHSVVLNVSTPNAWKTITIEDEGNGVTKIAVASIAGNTPQ